MKVVIVEDEKPSARRLHRIVSALGLQVQTMLHSVEEAVIWFSKNEQPDLLFLDIQLSDGLSFEIFEQVDVTSAIIFTTAYDEFALKAFKLNSIDYLLKPIDEEELKMAIDKFKVHKEPQVLDINSIKSLLKNSDKEYKERFSVKVGQHLKIIPTETIECLFSEHKGTYIQTNENRSYVVDNSLEYWGEQLNPKYFYKVNRTFIININAIKDIISYSNSRLKLQLNHYDGQEIIVSRERVKDFKEWIS